MEAQEMHKKLFEDLKFFMNLEVPPEALAFIIRSFGGICPGTSLCASEPHMTSQTLSLPTRLLTGQDSKPLSLAGTMYSPSRCLTV